MYEEVGKLDLYLRNVDSMSTRGGLAVLSDVDSCSLMNCLFPTHLGVLLVLSSAHVDWAPGHFSPGPSAHTGENAMFFQPLNYKLQTLLS